MKKILYVTTALSVGGAETQVVSLSCALANRGWDVCIISLVSSLGFKKQLKEHNIRIETLGMRRYIPDLYPFFKFNKLVATMRPCVIHSHMVHANIFARLTIGWRNGPPLICTAHSIFEGGWLRERAYQMTDSLSSLNTHISREGLARYQCIKAFRRTPSMFIPNGVDTQKFGHVPNRRLLGRRQYGLSDGSFVWLAVGRLEPVKNYEFLLEAYRRYSSQYPTDRLCIAGKGPLYSSLAHRTHILGIKDKVKYLGMVDDISDLMMSADGFILTSHYEGLPMVILEALSSGLPIIAPNICGARELVPISRYQTLYKAGVLDELVNNMKVIRNLSNVQKSALSKNNRDAVIANYSIDKVVRRWEEIYEIVGMR
jgi:glycosyltransferase involved in cell wall biosynthesis